MFWLVLAILLTEIFRTILSIVDSRKVRRLNRDIGKHLAERDEEWKRIQLAELAELKELAKGSNFLEGVIEGIEAQARAQKG